MNDRWLTDATAQTPGLRGWRSPRTAPRGKGDRTRRLSDHFAEVSARYRALRELDHGAVRILGNVVARAADQERPVRLLDVATGSGRYLDAVSQRLSAVHALEIVPIGLDLSPAMLAQAHLHPGPTGPRARHVVGTVETLPVRTASCNVMTCFNAVHHVDLARFVVEASRVLTPSGQLVVYTRTPEQNRRTIWGHHFPEFATRETRLYEVEDLRAALQATGAFTEVRTQTVPWTVTTSLSRLVEQAANYHYSTFRLYADDALRAAIDTFRQRVGQACHDVTRITYANDHLLVMAQRQVT